MKIPGGQITEAGIRNNISVCLQYLDKWLGGMGAVAIHNLMEDAATAEISRTQLWQWLHHRAQMSSGVVFDRDLYLMWRSEELKKIRETQAAPRLERAMTILDDLVLRQEFTEFLTLESYPRLLEPEKLFLNWSLPNTRGGNHERTTAGF
jgi:malate synthase